jgi:carbon monoxide dehydrogenase subunit G
MKVNGTATLNAPIEQVWAALNDPAVLAATIPGCERLEATGPDSYRMTITAGVASITGTYVGDVALTDQQPFGSFTLRASGSGTPGTVSADVAVRLEELGEGTTALNYDADAVVGGPIGGVGQRVLTAVSKKMARQFFAAVDAVIANGGLPVAPLPAAGTGLGATGPAGAGTAAAGTAGAGALGSPAIGTTFRAPGATATARDIRFDLKTQLPGVVLGAVIALAGVLLGSRITRRR